MSIIYAFVKVWCVLHYAVVFTGLGEVNLNRVVLRCILFIDNFVIYLKLYNVLSQGFKNLHSNYYFYSYSL